VTEEDYMRPLTSDNSPSGSLIISGAGGLPATLDPDLEGAAGYARLDKSATTRREYRSDFALFRAWCDVKTCTCPAHRKDRRRVPRRRGQPRRKTINNRAAPSSDPLRSADNTD
jgi:hypothetical protein